MIAHRIRVELGARSHDILVGDGLLDEAGALIAPLLKRKRVVVVTDANVERAQGARLKAALSAAANEQDWIALAPGEGSKSFTALESLVEKLAALEVDRSDLAIAFGGGVVGDVAGFACAILRRGVRFVQVPTTLLAQVDSAVGGKTAVNLSAGKNLAGAFHQPSLVIADVSTLETLDQRAIRSGFAEIVKYAALGDAGLFTTLERDAVTILSGDRRARIEAVAASCKMKAGIVARDETENGERALLNLGHTFGHAMEAALGFSDRLTHGEAVAAGMGLAFDYSVERGFCPPEDAARLKAILALGGLPPGPEAIADLPGAAAILGFMRQDKKAAAGRLSLVLVKGLGRAFVEREADGAELSAFLKMRFPERMRR